MNEDEIRADERRKIAAELRDEAKALERYQRDGGNPTSPVSAAGARALARFIEPVQEPIRGTCTVCHASPVNGGCVASGCPHSPETER